MKKIAIILLAAAAAAALAQTKINPASNLAWPMLTGNGAPVASCSPANYGQPYTDMSTTPKTESKCTPHGWDSGITASGITVTSPLTPASGGTGEAGSVTGIAYHNGSSPDSAATPAQIQSVLSGGVVNAFGYIGTDACAKISAAITDAASRGMTLVDATGFSGTQACATDFMSQLRTGMTLLLGNVWFQSTVHQHIAANGVTVRGQGMYQTVLQYTGANTSDAVTGANGVLALTQGAASNLQDVSISGLFLLGTGASTSANDGMVLQEVSYSSFRDIGCWGVINCLHLQGGITNKWERIRTSNGVSSPLHFGSGYLIPTHQIYADSAVGGSLGNTDTVVFDARAEGLQDVGWWLHAAGGFTFIGGTSESNTPTTDPGGVQIDVGSNNNTFVNTDFESNTTFDVLDNGKYNRFLNVIAVTEDGNGNSIYQGATSQFSTVDLGTTYGVGQISGAAYYYNHTQNSIQTPGWSLGLQAGHLTVTGAGGSTGLLQLPSATTCTGGIYLYTDVCLYRYGANILASNGNFLLPNGNIYLSNAYGIQNVNAGDNASFYLYNAGALISRNIADGSPALIVNNAKTTSTGDILDLQFAGAKMFSFGPTGGFNVASARKGTFTCTAGGTISVTNSNFVSTSDVLITMHTAGGTITTPPALKTVTSGTGFSVLCGASDTSTYNYDVLN